MKESEARPLTLAVGESGRVSALWLAPAQPRACYVFAHGAGAGMTHPSMAAFAEGLAARDVATLRFQFPYMEKGSKRPDAPAIAQAAVRAAVAEAARLGAGLPLFAGGRSFGGRMTSQAQAKAPLPGVRGLAFVGFPLHPAGRPGTERAAHLSSIEVPMLFLQGTRDELASLDLLHPVLDALGAHATLELIDDADHSFHVRARSGRNDAQAREAMLDATVAWMATIAAR
jgi:predicted alpha/beta-hydrolase family hydrolase